MICLGVGRFEGISLGVGEAVWYRREVVGSLFIRGVAVRVRCLCYVSICSGGEGVGNL